MNNFGKKSSGGRNFSKNNDRDRRFDSRKEGRPEMFKAICADCGKPCEIPFKPNNSRPVFCSTCFSEHSEGSDHSDFKKKEMFEATCDKCGKRCEVPFKPVSGKPVFCSQCFDRDNGGRDNRDSRDNRDRAPRDNNHDHNTSNNNDIYKERFEKLNAKLDMILSALNTHTPSESKKEKVLAEVKEIKAVAEKTKSIEKKIDTSKKNKVKPAAPKKTIVKKLDKKRKK